LRAFKRDTMSKVRVAVGIAETLFRCHLLPFTILPVTKISVISSAAPWNAVWTRFVRFGEDGREMRQFMEGVDLSCVGDDQTSWTQFGLTGQTVVR
jgi:hypothetical protein